MAFTLDQANGLLRRELTASVPRVIYYGRNGGDGAERLLRVPLHRARAAPVTAYVAQPPKPWTHTDFGPAGQVADRQVDADKGVTRVRFANGVRLVVKTTAFARDQVLVALRFGHGQLDLPRDRVAASDLGPDLLWKGGLTDLKWREIGETLLGRHVVGVVKQQADAFEITNAVDGASLRAEDLTLQMQLMATMVTAPGWRADDWTQFIADDIAAETTADASPGEALRPRSRRAALHSGDLRWALSTSAMRIGWRPEDAEAFLKPILDASPLEVTIVGDVSADAAIAAVAQTLEALPPRTGAPEPAGLRDVRFPPGNAAPLVLRHTGPAREALVVVNWPATDALADTRRTEAARVLADVMRSRLFDEIRVRHGWTYSPSVVADFSQVLPGYGMITARVTTAPDDAPAVLGAIDAIAADLAAGDITADELARAVGPRVEAARQSQQTNSYWLTTLAAAQRDPRVLNLATRTIAELQSLTPADIRAAAEAWLVKSRSWRAEVLPAPIELGGFLGTGSPTSAAPE